MTIETVINLILSLVGKNNYTQDMELRPLVFDGWSDCSSLMWKTFERGVGLQIGTYTDAQWANGELIWLCDVNTHAVSKDIQGYSGMQRGDLLFWASNGSDPTRICSHVEMYLGNDQCVGHGGGVGPTIKKLSTYYHPNKFLGVRRYISNEQPITDFYTGNFYLNDEQMFTNAFYLWNKLSILGWTLESICGFLGNTQIESTHNPGIYQSLDETHPQPWGFGLVQWTPYTNYTDWCESNNLDPTHMDSAIARIMYELDNGLQYYPTSDYPETFYEYTQSTKTPEYLAYAFLNNYERPSDRDQPKRQTIARYWYELFQGLTPPDPDPPTPVIAHKMPIWMMLKRI